VLAAQEHAVEVDRVHGAPLLEAGVLGIVRGRTALEAGHAGVIDQHVQPAFGGDHLIQYAAPVILGAHVERCESRSLAQGGGLGAGDERGLSLQTHAKAPA
jgi:hypothetical protein